MYTPVITSKKETPKKLTRQKNEQKRKEMGMKRDSSRSLVNREAEERGEE